MPVDVDFDVELVRTDRINVMYILSLLKSAHDAEKSDEERARDIDLVMREIERSDNDALRAKKDIMEAFIRTRFYDLPEDADIQQAYEQFERESCRPRLSPSLMTTGLMRRTCWRSSRSTPSAGAFPRRQSAGGWPRITWGF